MKKLLIGLLEKNLDAVAIATGLITFVTTLKVTETFGLTVTLKTMIGIVVGVTLVVSMIAKAIVTFNE